MGFSDPVAATAFVSVWFLFHSRLSPSLKFFPSFFPFPLHFPFNLSFSLGFLNSNPFFLFTPYPLPFYLISFLSLFPPFSFHHWFPFLGFISFFHLRSLSLLSSRFPCLPLFPIQVFPTYLPTISFSAFWSFHSLPTSSFGFLLDLFSINWMMMDPSDRVSTNLCFQIKMA